MTIDRVEVLAKNLAILAEGHSKEWSDYRTRARAILQELGIPETGTNAWARMHRAAMAYGFTEAEADDVHDARLVRALADLDRYLRGER